MTVKPLRLQFSKLNIYYVCKILFLICVILNAAFGESVEMYQVSKLVILAFMCASLLYILMRRTVVLSYGLGLLLLTFTYWLMSLFWTPNQSGATQMISTLFQLLLLCFFILQAFDTEEPSSMYVYALYFAGFFLMAYALSRYGVSGFFTELQSGERMGGDIANANSFGLVFAYAFIAGIYIYLYKRKNRLVLLGCAPQIVFALSSGSKKAIIAIAIGTAGLLFFRFGWRKLYKFVFWIAVAGVLFYFVLNLPIFSTTHDRLLSFLEGGNNFSDSIRSNMRKTGIELFLQRPIAGFGLAAFAEISGFGVYSHCNYTEQLANGGIIGFGLYYSVYAYAIIKLVPQAIAKKNPAILLLILNGLRLMLDYGMVSYGGKASWILIGVTLSTIYTMEKGRDKHDFKNQESFDGPQVGAFGPISDAAD